MLQTWPVERGDDMDGYSEYCEFCGFRIGSLCDGKQEESVNPYLEDLYGLEVVELLCSGEYYILISEI